MSIFFLLSLPSLLVSRPLSASLLLPPRCDATKKELSLQPRREALARCIRGWPPVRPHYHASASETDANARHGRSPSSNIARALLQMPRWNFNEILSDVSVNLIKRSPRLGDGTSSSGGLLLRLARSKSSTRECERVRCCTPRILENRRERGLRAPLAK